MRRFPFVTVPLLALAGCSSEAPDPRGVDRSETLLQVSATGRADTRPDEARFSAGVQTIAATAAAASSGNNAVINRVLAAVERLGVKKDDVQTRQVTLSRIGYGPNRGRFEANNMVEIRVRDMARAGEAIAAATEAGANVLSGPDLTIADPDRAARSAYAAAYRAARARADAYAEAAGLKVARVLVIRDSQGHPGFPGYGAADAAVAETAPTVAPPPIRAGVTTSQVTVRADFALAPR
jgi:hypothetical protein